MAGRDAESDLIRGNIDAIVLNALTSGDSYGYEILKGVAQTSLKRLEGQGLVESYWGSESQGARRKYYHITEGGLGELAEATARWVRARTVIDRLLSQDGGAT